MKNSELRYLLAQTEGFLIPAISQVSTALEETNHAMVEGIDNRDEIAEKIDNAIDELKNARSEL